MQPDNQQQALPPAPKLAQTLVPGMLAAPESASVPDDSIPLATTLLPGMAGVPPAHPQPVDPSTRLEVTLVPGTVPGFAESPDTKNAARVNELADETKQCRGPSVVPPEPSASTLCSDNLPSPFQAATPPGSLEVQSASPPAPDLACPTTSASLGIPGYEVLGELGRGGMGVVYKVRQTKLKRLAAVKMILSGPNAGSQARARFLAEAEACARLQHANIIQIYEIGEVAGNPFFSLEFVDGGSLEGHLKGKLLQPRNAAELLQVLALAVHAAHEKGVVHRDLKPANVLLQKQSKSSHDGPEKDNALAQSILQQYIPKITDFGLAKSINDGDSARTRDGEIMGTPSYMAPEQAAGSQKDIGPATDVYALGAILYEFLTGRPPFRAATAMETVMQVLREDPVPFTAVQRPAAARPGHHLLALSGEGGPEALPVGPGAGGGSAALPRW